MNCTKEIPKEPGYYFINYFGDEYMVEIVQTQYGFVFFEFNVLNMIDCKDMEGAEWLGPIKSEDIVNLWRNFKEETKCNEGIMRKIKKQKEKK